MVSLLVSVAMIVTGLVQARSQPAKASGPPSETATQFYLRYRAAAAKATSVDPWLVIACRTPRRHSSSDPWR